MKIISTLFLGVGFVVLLIGAGLLFKNIIDINQLWAVANANRSTPFFNPRQEVMIMASLLVIGGFLLGLGLSMPKGRRKIQ